MHYIVLCSTNNIHIKKTMYKDISVQTGVLSRITQDRKFKKADTDFVEWSFVSNLKEKKPQ